MLAVSGGVVMRRIVCGLVLVGLVAACAGGAGSTTTTPVEEPTTPSTTGGGITVVESTTTKAVSGSDVEVVRDLVYHSGSEEEWFAPLVDVYAPAEAEGGLSVVVLFHGGPGIIDKDWDLYRRLATHLAERGAVVYVPNWSSPLSFPDPDDAYVGMLREEDGAACAVSYAVETAAEYGGDPDRLILFGHSAGAMVGSVVGLRETVQLPECSVEMAPIEPDRMVLWEGDWLFTETYWDQWEEGIPTIRPAFTPWTWLEEAGRPEIVLVMTAGATTGLTRCGVDPGGPWYAWRDPDGWFAERFEAIGAFDDGCLDVSEPQEILADTMIEAGFTVEELFLPDSGHEYLSDLDEQAVLDAVLRTATTMARIRRVQNHPLDTKRLRYRTVTDMGGSAPDLLMRGDMRGLPVAVRPKLEGRLA
jgi:pimeloyl-ACP methyl ester carboxylesterase